MSDLERVEAEALRSAAIRVGGIAADAGGAVCTAYPPTRVHPILNRATPVSAEVDVDAIEGFFAEAVTSFVLAVTREHDELERELESRGYERGQSWMKFSRDLAAPPPVETELEVAELVPPVPQAIVDAFGAFFGVSLWDRLPGLDGWHCFVARAGDEPAATAALFAHDRVGWLGAAGTRPEFQRRGGQSALLAARIDRARELGLRKLVSETGERLEGRPAASYRNLLRAGFREEYVRANWRAPA